MSEQVTITLSLIAKYTPCSIGWKKVLEANGGVGADYEKLFPLSSVLDSNNLDHTLWCFRCLPEHRRILERFVLFCAKEGSKSTSIEAVHSSIKVIERYVLKGDIPLKTVWSAYNDSYNAVYGEASQTDGNDDSTYPARAVFYAAYTLLTMDMATASDTSVKVAFYGTSSLVNTSTAIEKQRTYLRKLLDGEI